MEAPIAWNVSSSLPSHKTVIQQILIWTDNGVIVHFFQYKQRHVCVKKEISHKPNLKSEYLLKALNWKSL